MAQAISVGDVLSNRVWTSCGEQAAVNSYNYTCVSLVGGAISDQDFCNAFDLVVDGFYKNWMPTGATYRGTQTYFMKKSGLLPAPVKSIANAGGGVTGTDPVPRSSAAIFKYASFSRGPSGRGRLYLPFISTQFMTALGLPNATLNTAIDNLGTTLLPGITVVSGGNSCTLSWSLLHRQPAPTPPSTSLIVSAGSAGKMGVMHKRGDYGRANQVPI